jgi:hypothetical protein
MRFLLLVCLCLTASGGQQSTPVPAAGSAAASNQQKARAVLDQMIAALGGQAYLNVQDSYSEGRYGRFHNEVMIGGAKYFRTWKWPDSDRWEITDQRDIVQLFIGDKATEVTWQGARAMNPEKEENVRQWLVRRHYTLEVVLRVWLNETGTLLLDEGPTLAENRMAERITIINSRNESVSLLVSPDTHLPVQKIFISRDPQTRDRDEEIEIFDNWRMVQGVNTPFNLLIKRNGQLVRQQFVFNVTYNNHPPDSIFAPKLIRYPRK